MTRARDTADIINRNPILGNGTVDKIVEVTQSEYDALTPEANTVYMIVG